MELTPVTDAVRAETALSRAWSRSPLAHARLKLLLTKAVEAGWTPQHVHRAVACLEHADTAGTDLSRYFADYPSARVQMAAELSNLIADTLTVYAVPTADEMLGWLAVVAGAPRLSDTFTLHEDARGGLLKDTVSSGGGIWPILLELWQQTIPGPLAALAWAAGLTLGEARDQYAAGSLTDEGLRTLTTLRGYRLPADLAAGAEVGR